MIAAILFAIIGLIVLFWIVVWAVHLLVYIFVGLPIKLLTFFGVEPGTRQPRQARGKV